MAGLDDLLQRVRTPAASMAPPGHTIDKRLT